MADADSVFASNAIEAFALHSHVLLALLQYLGLDIFGWCVAKAGASRDIEIRFEKGERVIAMKYSLRIVHIPVNHLFDESFLESCIRAF